MNFSITLNKIDASKFWLDVFGEMVGVGAGLVTFQSLLTIKSVLALSISNRVSLFRSFWDNKWPFQNFYQIHFGKIRGVGGIHPPITLNLKNGLRTSDYQSNEPPSKFVRPPFLYIPYATRTCFITLALRAEGDVILKDIMSRPFKYVNQNAYFKILIGCVYKQSREIKL